MFGSVGLTSVAGNISTVLLRGINVKLVKRVPGFIIVSLKHDKIQLCCGEFEISLAGDLNIENSDFNRLIENKLIQS